MSLLEIANLFLIIGFVGCLFKIDKLKDRMKTEKSILNEIDGWVKDESVSDKVKVEQVRTILQFRKSEGWGKGESQK